MRISSNPESQGILVLAAALVVAAGQAQAQASAVSPGSIAVRGGDPHADPVLARWEHHCLGRSGGIVVIEALSNWRRRESRLTQLRFKAVSASAKTLERVNAALPNGTVLIYSSVLCAPDNHQIALRYRRLGGAYATGQIYFALRDDGGLIDDDVVVSPPHESDGP